MFGTGLVADAFVVAFRFPNLFRRLFGEGAFNSAFVPLFARRLEGEGPSAARQFAEEAMAGLVFVLLLLSAICMLAMPWLMYGLAPGFARTRRSSIWPSSCRRSPSPICCACRWWR